jgi:hypothetical protein
MGAVSGKPAPVSSTSISTAPASRRSAQGQPPATGHGLDGIAAEVKERLPDAAVIERSAGVVGAQLQGGGHVGGAGLGAQGGEHLAAHLVLDPAAGDRGDRAR